MSFTESVFPLKIGFGATGGPRRKTQVVITASGREERNQQWANSRRTWDVGAGIRDIEEAESVSEFFEDVRGKLYGFRFCDPLDLKSCPVMNQPTATDQAIGTGDDNGTEFQLLKKYGNAQPYFRRISKPVDGTVLIAVDGVPLQPSEFSVDVANGLVTLNSPPAPGQLVTAGYKYHVPVRFDTDALDIAWENHRLISVPSIPIIELIL